MTGANIYQYFRIAGIYLVLLIFCHMRLLAQNIIGVVDYMKVDEPEAYLELEEQWQKIHEERLKQGMIIGWAVYKVMFKTTEDPHNFVSISWYDSFSKLDKGVPDDILQAAYPEKSEQDWKAFNELTEKSRKLVSSGVFHQRISCSNGLDPKGQFYVISEISVKPGKSSREFLKLSEEIYKPLYVEDIKNNHRTGWSLWEKWPGNMKDFQYGTADGYASLDMIDHSNFMDYFRKIHPDKDPDEISERMEELRALVNSEMWKLMLRVLK